MVNHSDFERWGIRTRRWRRRQDREGWGLRRVTRAKCGIQVTKTIELECFDNGLGVKQGRRISRGMKRQDYPQVDSKSRGIENLRMPFWEGARQVSFWSNPRRLGMCAAHGKGKIIEIACDGLILGFFYFISSTEFLSIWIL